MKTFDVLLKILFLFILVEKSSGSNFDYPKSTFHIKNFSKIEYKAENQNWSLSCGHDGFVYIANNAGLLVYDGSNWDFYTSPNINNIRSVKVDEKTGRIYTSGYREVGFWQWDSIGSLQYQSLRPLIEDQLSVNEEFWKIEITGDKIIFQSFSGIFIFNGKDFNILKPKTFINSFSVVNKKILLHIMNKGIYELSGDSIIPFFIGDIFQDKLIQFTFNIGNDSLLIGTENNGLFLYHNNKIEPAYPEYKEYFKTNTINRGILLNDSVIVIGTILDGIIGISTDGETLFKINKDNGLQNNTVLGFSVQDKNLWVSLDKGISFIDFSIDPDYEMHEITDVGAVYSAALYNNKLYLGTNQGLYLKDISDGDDKFILVQETQGQVWDCSIFDDKLFVGHNSGTFLIDHNTTKKISDVSGGFCIVDNPYEVNTLIQSTYSNLVYYKKEKGQWKISHTISNFMDLIRFIELDHLNNVWAGHMRRAIFKIQLNDEQDKAQKITYYGEESIFKKEYGINVFKLENRIVFTTGEILYTYDDINDSIVPYSQVNNSIGELSRAHRIIKAPNHHYWFITDNSVALLHFKLDRIDLIKKFPFSLFNSKLIEGYENVIPISEKKAILCLENGYAILDAEAIAQDKNLHKLTIKPKRIAVFGKSMKEERLPITSDNFVIPFSKNNIHINYSFPYYSAKGIKYKYFIEGLNTSWSEAIDKPEFEFNRIPPGEYIIKVIAEDEWGEQSYPHALTIKILAPWYSSIVAIILYAILLITIVFTVRHYSIKRIKVKEKLKREHKEQELIKLRNQNLRNKLSYKSQELANSTMSIIKKNEFLLKLKDVLQKQKDDLGTRYPDKYYNHIVSKIDNHISQGEDWKIFETNVEQAHEQFIQKLITKYPQLTHSDLRLCTYLRMNLSSKEIAPLMKISIRGVENHRYRIRKKLDLPSEVNLTDFILGFKI